MTEGRMMDETVEYEVWRRTFDGRHDMRVQRGSSEKRARQVLNECRDDPSPMGRVEFYLVKVMTQRTAVDA